MASKEDISVVGKLGVLSQNSSVSSHDEEYNEISYGSDILDPGLSVGFVRVHDDCCRVMYRPSKARKDSGMYVCLNKSSCRSHY